MKSPKRTTDMKAVHIPLMLRRGYDALTFFGVIVTRTKDEAEKINSRYDTLKNHEMIHLYQARATRNSWICFYCCYAYYWLQGLFCARKVKNAGYRLNPFEMEAYRHMNDLHYLDNKQTANEWQLFAAMTAKERAKFMGANG